MVRKYVCKTSRGSTPPDTILSAAEAVIQDGKSIRTVAAEKDINVTTLWRYIKKVKQEGCENVKFSKGSIHSVFSEQQEHAGSCRISHHSSKYLFWVIPKGGKDSRI